MIQTIRRYLTGEKGVAYIEFALVLPILLFLFLGAVEMTRFIMANQKVDKASHGLANFLSMQEDPMNVNMGQLNNAFSSLLSPFGTTDAGFRMLELRPQLNNEQADGYPLRVEDAKTSGAAGGTRVGVSGGPVTGDVIRDIRITRGEFLVAVETYLTYKNIVPGMNKALEALGFSPSDNDGQELYKRTVVRHRLANFEILEGRPANPANPECCGGYCDVPPGGESRQPSCACNGGVTCHDWKIENFPRCTPRADYDPALRRCTNTGGGGGGTNPPNCETAGTCSGGGG